MSQHAYICCTMLDQINDELNDHLLILFGAYLYAAYNAMTLQNRIYDLHCHSDQSDGILSPEALVSRAKEQEVSVLALTDHDTVIGLSRAKEKATQLGIELINGIEFSTQWCGRNIHIVALNFDLSCDALLSLVESQENRRIERAIEIAQRLEKVGISGSLEGAKVLSGDGVVGRPHFAKYLVKESYVSSVDQAFKKYLGNGKIGDVKQHWPSFDEVIPVIVESGGIAVIAHPKKYDMTRSKLCELIEDFIATGGRAIEVVSGRQPNHEVQDLVRIANKYNLLASIGSDFHYPGTTWSELGVCKYIPEGIQPVWSAWEN